MHEILLNVLSVAVLVTLLGAMMFLTGMLKAKNDPQQKKKHTRRALIFLVLYAIFNVLRLMLEKGML